MVAGRAVLASTLDTCLLLAFFVFMQELALEATSSASAASRTLPPRLYVKANLVLRQRRPSSPVRRTQPVCVFASKLLSAVFRQYRCGRRKKKAPDMYPAPPKDLQLECAGHNLGALGRDALNTVVW